MRHAFNFTVVLTAALLGLVFGKILHSTHSADSSKSIYSSKTAEPGLISRLFNRTRRPRADDSPLATQLAMDLSMSSGVTRWLRWMEALEKAGISDFPRLAQMAKGNPTLLQILSTRWIETNPRNLFDTLLASGNSLPKSLVSDLFAEWPKRDLEGVIAALTTTNGFSNWRMSVAGSIVEVDVERGLSLLSSWHIDNFTPRMDKVAAWAAADSRHAAEYAMTNPCGYASQEIMRVIGKEWAKKDPAAAMDFAAAHPGGMSANLSASALKEWSSRNLEEASKWLTGTDAATRNRLSPTFVESWARVDAASALAWCDVSLSGAALARSVGAVVKGVAEKDITAAATLVNEMSPSLARAEAASAIAEKWIPNDIFNGQKQPIPPAAIEWLKGLDTDSLKQALSNTGWRWTELDPKGFARFVASVNEEAVPEYTYNNLARLLARQDPAGALEWAQKVPGEQGAQAATEAFNEWRNSQPAEAMKWLAALPDSNPQKSVFYQRVISNLSYDPQGAEQLASWSPTEKAIALPLLQSLAITPEKKARFLEVLKK